MTTLSARQRNGQRLWSNSPLKAFNEARKRATLMNPVRLSHPDGQRLAAGKLVTLLKDVIERTPKAEELSGERECHLLLEDVLNPDYFATKALYDIGDKQMKSGHYICDVHEGPVALHPDTLIRWM